VTADAGVLVNNGTVFIDGGTLNVSAGLLVGIGTNGAVNISSGVLNTDAFNVGNGTQTGAITQSGGTCNISGSLLINPSCSYTCQNSPAINLGGNWTNNGSFTSATSTVSFNGSAQSIGGSAATNFYNLSFSGSGIKTFGAARTISGIFSINTGVKANLGTFTSSTNTLILGGSPTAAGSWGSSSSPATNTNDIFFTATTGIINVNTSSCSGSIVTSVSQSNIACFGANDGTITISASGGTGPYTFSIHNGTPASTYQPGNIFTGLGPGVYQIRVKDANGCESKSVQ
jgi:SprB repeat